jgi:hypothetical protein
MTCIPIAPEWALQWIDTAAAVVGSVVLLLTAWLFKPYYFSMYRYRKSGMMKKESQEVVDFVIEWAKK